MSTPAPAKRKTLGQIEVMRVIAVTGIFLYHLWSDVPKAGTENPMGPAFGAILSQGWLGVILFNVVTGFVLTLPFAGPSGRPMPGYLEFLRHRFLRICPNYYIGLVFWTIVAIIAGKAGASLASSFTQHLLFVHTLNPAVFFDIVPAYWWMGLLAQFYLLYPVLWGLFTKFGPKKAALWLCCGCWGFWAVLEILAKLMPGSIFSMGNYLFYFNLPYRLGEFALGMFLACKWRDPDANPVIGQGLSLGEAFSGKRTAAWIGLIVLSAWALLFGIPGPFLLVTHLYWLSVVFCAGLAIFFSDTMDRLGTWGPVSKFAAASYSIYLMHQPILGYAAQWVAPNMEPFPAFIFLTGACGLLSIWVALLTDRLVAKINTLLG
ncbi:MAG: acyltransferase [Desulfovibrio sp.]|jgi:peptidoglycan/LPS O-acetylase OafA/YrhL|nr:acyltransferase [Desulfovibrio sp.]MBI4960899.1 acyltransferase [Desulfovibrio sp.]